MLQYRDVKCKTVTILFGLLIIPLTVYKITRFIADGKWDGRCDWLQTTAKQDIVWSIWAGDHSESSSAHLKGEWQFHTKSNELIGAFLACPPDWARGPPLLRSTHRTLSTASWLPDNCICLADSLSKLSMRPRCQGPTFIGKCTQQPSCTNPSSSSSSSSSFICSVKWKNTVE